MGHNPLLPPPAFSGRHVFPIRRALVCLARIHRLLSLYEAPILAGERGAGGSNEYTSNGGGECRCVGVVCVVWAARPAGSDAASICESATVHVVVTADKQTVLRRAAGVVLPALVVSPFVISQIHWYQQFCPSNTLDGRPEWCSNRLPLVYTYVQEKYWLVSSALQPDHNEPN